MEKSRRIWCNFHFFRKKKKKKRLKIKIISSFCTCPTYVFFSGMLVQINKQFSFLQPYLDLLLNLGVLASSLSQVSLFEMLRYSKIKASVINCSCLTWKTSWFLLLCFNNWEINQIKYNKYYQRTAKLYSTGIRTEKILTLVLLNQDMFCLCKQCRSRSVGF